MALLVLSNQHSNQTRVEFQQSNCISIPSHQQMISNWNVDSDRLSLSEKLRQARKRIYSFVMLEHLRTICVVSFVSLSITVAVLTISFTSSRPAMACTSSLARTWKSSLVSSSEPRSITVADLNNDTLLDLVVANYGTDTIGIFFSQGQGHGNFNEQITYSTGASSRPHSVTIADFNADKHLDIAVANYGTNSIGIFLGYANGSFSYSRTISLDSSRPILITTGDFNGDSQVDIAVVNYGTSSIGILLGYGNATFQSYQTYSTGYDSHPSSLVVGCFNNDSHLDIAVANYGTDNMIIFLGIGNGSFEHHLTYSIPLGSNPSSISVGDFNADNRLDIVVSNNGSGNLEIFFGDGDGTFQQQQTYLIGSDSYPQYVSVGDLNGDNHLDLVAVDSINDQIHIIRGAGDGRFDLITTYDGIHEYHPFCVALADLNANNQTDIVVVNSGSNSILILIDYFIMPSARKTILFYDHTNGLSSVAVGDLNNDRIPDIIFNSGDLLFIFLGLGDGHFVENANYSAGSHSVPQYICVGDVNNDNQTDIITANTGAGSVGVFLGHGNGSFSQVQNYSTGINSEPWWIALGDFNQDNALDIVSANSGSVSIGILLGYGNGSFAPVIISPMASGFPPDSVAVGYINSDNYLDFVVSDDGNRISIYFGLGNGSFYLNTRYHAGGAAFLFSVALADFNNDNYLDIVAADAYAGRITVFMGYGNGSFSWNASYATGTNSQPYYVIVNDFNNDHINDIAVSNWGTDDIFIFYGDENGSFGLGRNFSTGYSSGPYGITAAHLDINQQLEIVVALWGTRQIAVLTEYYAAQFQIMTIFATGSAPRPHSVDVSKYESDPRLLLVTANSGSDSLNILFTWNNDTFGKEITYSLGENSRPECVITCDINKDKHLDIVNVNSESDSISVILGGENETFKDQIIYSTGDRSHPSNIISSDLNKDTRLDLVVTNTGTGEIGIFYGSNYTTFQLHARYSNDVDLAPVGIGVSDFNNDGRLDIAVAFSKSGKIGILLGYGNGSFPAITTYSTGSGSSPQYLGVGDFNNDNRTDIAVTNYANNSIGIFLGHGNGSFANMLTYSAGRNANPLGIAVGDLNNDSQLDIVVANSRSNHVGILRGYGNGNFSPIQLCSTGDRSSPYSVVIADMNNDNRLDITVANYLGDTVGIFFGYGNGTFQNQVAFSIGHYSYPFWISVGDFNNDNQLDIAVALWNENRLVILFGSANESFTKNSTHFTGPGSLPAFTYAGDFDRDTYLDVAVVNRGTHDIVIFFGIGDGTFLPGKPFATGINSSPQAMAVADFDHDSQFDVVVTNLGSNDIVVFLGDDHGPFGAIHTLSTGIESEPHAVAVGDCNNDGQIDLIVANYGADNVGVFLGYPTRNFGKMMIHSTGRHSSPYYLALVDLNNDDNLDIVVTNSESSNIMIMFGIGNGSFPERITYSTGERSRPYQIVINDMNNDHISDLIIANSGTSNILFLYGLGNGTFGNASSYDLGYGYEPYSIAVNRLNNDGKFDIIVACFGTDHIEILIRIC